MAHRFTMTRRVQFAETDMAGIMHFTYFFRFMEETEHAFYRSLGFTVQAQGEGGPEPSSETNPDIGWPRVSAACDYHLPLRFEEEVEIELLVEEIRGKSVHYQFRFWKNPNGADSDRALAAAGQFTVLCVKMDKAAGTMKACEIPGNVRAALEEAPESVLERPEKT